VITVSILINGQPIFTRSAVRVDMKNGMGYYKVDDGKIIQHRYESGAVPLAQKMLKTIKEPIHSQIKPG